MLTPKESVYSILDNSIHTYEMLFTANNYKARGYNVYYLCWSDQGSNKIVFIVTYIYIYIYTLAYMTFHALV